MTRIDKTGNFAKTDSSLYTFYIKHMLNEQRKHSIVLLNFLARYFDLFICLALNKSDFCCSQIRTFPMWNLAFHERQQMITLCVIYFGMV